MAGLILKMSFVLLRSIFFSVLMMILVVVWLSWNVGWLVEVRRGSWSSCCCGIVWLVLCPIVMKRSFSAFAMLIGSLCSFPL